MAFENPSAAYAAANPNAKAGDTFTVGGVAHSFDPVAAGSPKAPTTQNKRVDSQPDPGKFPMVQATATPTSFHADSHDPAAMGNIKGKMNKEGEWTTEHHDSDGNTNSVNHGAEKSSTQAKSADTVGHSDDRVGGGSRSQSQNGTHHENGGDGTDAVKGSKQSSTESSAKNYSQGGDGHHVMKGDQSFVVDEGGVHYDVAQDFTISAKGAAVHLISTNELSFNSGGSEGHEVGNTLVYNVAESITLKCGSSTIVMTPSGITITASAINFVKA